LVIGKGIHVKCICVKSIIIEEYKKDTNRDNKATLGELLDVIPFSENRIMSIAKQS